MWRLHIVRCYEPVSQAQQSADNFGVTLSGICVKLMKVPAGFG